MNPVEDASNGGAAARTRAHARATRHSDRVRRLRRLIPLAAGGSVAALLAYLFNPFAASLPGVTVGPVTLAGSKVRMESPKLSGFRKGSRGYEVTADAALQDVRKPSLIELERMRGHIATDDNGGQARLSAASGLFDTGRETLDLKTDIRIDTDRGEAARLRSAAVAFKTGSITSREPVSVSTPRGMVEADGLDVVENGRVISFVGNVRVVIGPEPAAAPRILTSDAAPAGDRP
ncbi:LPS export ABC transporter periplasmic protein LptC [Methylobacterium sp. NEAU 140]|uniref:LPS export ABC transporter periplasmic protein LptC n=1 Tax=Methylobacterium sp. NEAU 140 TaxID=3064945 RepID=UPI00273599C1|nr:LPS export ABC transporter periplasmic protein LptC [Methylobacterium sp. NEAU 140]MDP4021256.1 LPS export ABC transporter periplasmic protein LptC [Methylobacterium sp. NEAU 140]